jgi:hypothetical protein
MNTYVFIQRSSNEKVQMNEIMSSPVFFHLFSKTFHLWPHLRLGKITLLINIWFTKIKINEI